MPTLPFKSSRRLLLMSNYADQPVNVFAKCFIADKAHLVNALLNKRIIK